MKIGLGIYMSRELNSDLAVNTSNEMQTFFSKRDYGSGIMDISIGLICISKDYEPFFKPPKPKYSKGKKDKELDGFKWTSENLLEYPCKIDFHSYQNSNELERKTIIAKEILKTTREVLEKKKIPNFDNGRFLEDLELFFKNQK